MPRQTRSKSVPDAGRRWVTDLFGLGLITAGCLLWLGIATDRSGPLLVWLADGLAWLVGRLAWLVAAGLILAGLRWLVRGRPPSLPATSTGLILLIAVAAAGLHLRVPSGEEFLPTAGGTGLLHPFDRYGGLLGASLAWLLRQGVGQTGAIVVLITMALGGLIAVSERPVRELLDGLRVWWAEQRASWRDHRAGQAERQQRRRLRQLREAAGEATGEAAGETPPPALPHQGGRCGCRTWPPLRPAPATRPPTLPR